MGANTLYIGKHDKTEHRHVQVRPRTSIRRRPDKKFQPEPKLKSKNIIKTFIRDMHQNNPGQSGANTF